MVAKTNYLDKFKRDCLADISFFAENDIAPLYIAPEEGPINRVKLRRVQRRLAEAVNRQWFSRGFLRIVVCKARRIGSTTFFSMDAYRQAALTPNTNVVIGAQLDDDFFQPSNPRGFFWVSFNFTGLKNRGFELTPEIKPFSGHPPWRKGLR